MSASKKTNKYKESPYYGGGGGGNVDVQKSNNRLLDEKASDKNKLPKLTTHFGVPRPNRNPPRHEESSSPSWKAYFETKTIADHHSELASGPSKVKKLVSGFEKSLWGSKQSNKHSVASTVILKEDSFIVEEEEADICDVFDANSQATSFQCIDKQSVMVDQNPKNERDNATHLNSSQPARMLSDAPHQTLTPLRLFDVNSTSINPSPDMGDRPLPALPPHPQLVHAKKKEENEGSARFSNYPDKHRDRNSSMESQHLEDWALTLTTNHSGNNDMIQAQEKHGVETAAFSLIGAHSLGLNKQSTESIANEFRELSFKEQLVPKDKSNKFGEQAPHQAGLKREDSMDILNTVEDGPVNFKTKYENTVIKITGSHKDEKVFLSGVASAFYNGGSLSLHGVLCCPSVDKINEFLDDQREELHAGVPGKWLTVVLGRDSSELSTIVATTVYAYFLSLTTREDHLCIVPLVNMVRADLALHPDVTWLLDSVGLHLPSLLFLDEINLSYFHRFGSLRLVLVNHTMLCPGQESFKDDVEEILTVDEKVDNSYPHLKRVISDKDVGSSCTLIAEDFTKHHPELLAGRALCRLLLAGIVLDTKNLSSERTTRRDISMATLLLNGAGKFGRHGLFKILKQKSHDLTNMNTNQLLRKQFKMLNIGSSGTQQHSQQACFYEENVGMSSLPIPVNAVLAWEENSPVAIADFPRCMALGLFVLVTGFYESPELFKREILVVAKADKLIESISKFLLANKSVKCNLMPIAGLPPCMRGFTLEGKRISRTCIQNVLEAYFS
ncbi:hypothetical protein L7F22_021852 [Adiantum nelumboides]|nr:hypothetical protein [Adiantum nelumboides]